MAAPGAWGAGSTGSRLVTGSTACTPSSRPRWPRSPAPRPALVFSSGYTANLGAVTALSGRGALVVSDAADARLARGRRAAVPRPGRHRPHRRPASRRPAARRPRRGRAPWSSPTAWTASTAALAPLTRAARGVPRARRAAGGGRGARARGARAGGRGLLAEVGLAGADDVVATATLSKSLGSQGGAVLGPRAVIDHLVDAARAFIFDTGLAPSCAGAALAALRRRAGRARPGRRPARRAAGSPRRPLRRPDLAVPAPTAAMVPVVLGEPAIAVAAAAACAAPGVRAGLLPPALGARGHQPAAPHRARRPDRRRPGPRRAGARPRPRPGAAPGTRGSGRAGRRRARGQDEAAVAVGGLVVAESAGSARSRRRRA